MGLLSNFTKTSGKDPLSRIVDSATADIQAQIQNSVSDLFTEGMKKAGLSLPTGNSLAARFADSFKQGILDVYFRQASSAVERVLEDEIFDNIFPNYKAETVSYVKDRIATNAESITINNFTDASNLLQFPSHIGKYYMAMKFRCYTRTAPQAPARLDFKNAIVLPVPKNLSENFGMKISTDQTDLFGFVMDQIQAADAANREGASIDLGQVASDQGGAAAYLLMTTAGASRRNGLIGTLLGETGRGVAGQALRAIPNPHLATFFQGIEMRSYAFDWTFAPRNKEESQQVQNIIKQLKRNSLPTFSRAGTAALTYPDLCFIDMYPWAQNQGDELLKFKPALLRNVSINYAPNGIPSFFAGTTLPTFVQLKLEFVETEYFTGEDYGAQQREDGVANATDFFQGLGSSIFGEDALGDGQAATQDLNNIIPSTETPDITGGTSLSNISSALESEIPNGTEAADNVIATISVDGTAREVGVGRADGTRFVSATATDNVVASDGQYFITYEDSSAQVTNAYGPYDTVDEVLEQLTNGPLPIARID